METAKEIVSLIKFSPKRENLLGEIQGNLQGPESEAECILCPTRWTVHVSCFQRILDNYAALLPLMRNSDMSRGIIGCQMQMNTFDFSFALNLGQRLFLQTDNLSRTLQQTNMPTLSGKQIACLKKNVAEDAEDARMVRLVRVVRVVKQ